MLYTIVCKEPFVFLFNENEEILKSDYDFVVENPEECLLSGDIISEEYKPLTPSEFSKILDAEVKGEYVYTFVDGALVRKRYKKAPYFYVDSGCSFEYPTYCPDPNPIKAGLLTNDKLTEVISSLVQEYYQDCLIEVSSEVPLDVEDTCQPNSEVLAYVCIPVIMRKIPIGIETEEEHQEELEDQEEF